MGKINILFLIDVFFKMAGSERNCYELVSRIDKRVFDPIVVCLHDGSLMRLLSDKGIKTKNLNLGKIYSIKGLLRVFELIKLVKSSDIKIIVTYHESSDFFGALIGKLSGVPVVVSSRRDMGYKLKKRHILFYRIINKFFSKIVTVSEEVKESIFQRENVLWANMQTIYNGVDCQKFVPGQCSGAIKKSLGLVKNWPIVGILAALRPVKGHKFFLKSAAIVLKEIPSVYFFIVGSEDKGDEYKKLLSKYAKDLCIEKNVFFVGEVLDVPDALSSFDVSVLSSLNEGFPNVIIESMASGKPVVATNSGGTKEAVVDGITGFLVPSLNSEKLAVEVIKLLKDDNLRLQMGKNGRKIAEEKYNIQRMVTCYEDLYAKLLEEFVWRQNENRVNSRSVKNLFAKYIKTILSKSLMCSQKEIFFSKKKFERKGIKFLAYHKVSRAPDSLGMTISEETFEKQIRTLLKFFVPISLEEAFNLLNNSSKINDNYIVLTFDDGHKDNFINAYPILKKYNIPATIFLAVDAINKNEMLWFDVVLRAFMDTKQEIVDIKEIGLSKIHIKDIYMKMLVANKVIFLLKNFSTSKRNKFLDNILAELNFCYDSLKDNRSVLSWEEIKAMRENRISFGSHGMNHTILRNLPLSEIDYEVVRSKEIIEDRVKEKIKFFAYPNGGIDDYNDDSVALLKKNGYIGAVTLIDGFNKKSTDPFSLRRFCVSEKVSTSILGFYSESLFISELFGCFNFFKK